MVNVGWLNHQGSFPPSILRMKGDLEIWLSALLIASFPMPLEDLFMSLCSRWYSFHMRKTHQEESLIYIYNCHPLYRQKRSQNGREFVFAVRGATSSLNDQSLVVCLWYSLHERHDSPFETDFHQYGQYVNFLPGPFCAQDWGNHIDVGTPWILPGVDLIPPWLTVTLTIPQVLPIDDANCKGRFWIPNPRYKWIQAQ